MPRNRRDVEQLINDQLWPAFSAERDRLDRLDRWYRWDHDRPHQPRQATAEYRELSSRAQSPWLNLVVTSVAQALYVEGYRRARDPENAEPWRWWQANGMDGRQIAVHRAALAYGLAYGVCLPGISDQGEPMPVMRGVSPRRMIAFYADPAEDDWPAYALRADPARVAGAAGWMVRLYDDEAVYRLNADSSGRLTWIDFETHDVGFCPVVRFANQLDLEGRADSEVEPFIPVAGRIDQTTYDRLVVQRWGAWVVRTIAGMSAPELGDESVAAEKLRLTVDSILVAEDPDTKFGSLPATQLDGFIKAHESDIRDLAAMTQTPPHHLLGQMANLSAEALAAAEAGLSRKVEERKHAFGESHEQWLRLAAAVMGDSEGARDTEAQVRWRDMESRSLAQTADALGKLAQQLQVPVEMLWEKIPGWTDQDGQRAKALLEQGGALEQFMAELNAQLAPVPDGGD